MNFEERRKKLQEEARKLLETKEKSLNITTQCNSRLLEIQGALKELDILQKQEEDDIARKIKEKDKEKK